MKCNAVRDTCQSRFMRIERFEAVTKIVFRMKQGQVLHEPESRKKP